MSSLRYISFLAIALSFGVSLFSPNLLQGFKFNYNLLAWSFLAFILYNLWDFTRFGAKLSTAYTSTNAGTWRGRILKVTSIFVTISGFISSYSFYEIGDTTTSLFVLIYCFFAIYVLLTVSRVSKNIVSSSFLFAVACYILIILQTGATYQAKAQMGDLQFLNKSFRGKLINITDENGCNLGTIHMVCVDPPHIGAMGKKHNHEGGIAIMLDSGMPFSGASFGAVLDYVGKQNFPLPPHIHVCTYSRIGYGWGKPPAPQPGCEITQNAPRTSQRMAKELNLAIKTAGFDESLVLVGWSMGGVNMMLYKMLYPEKVLGVVLVDSSHPLEVQVVPQLKVEIEYGKFMFNLLKFLSPFGISRILGSYGMMPKECGHLKGDELLPSPFKEWQNAWFNMGADYSDVAYKELDALQLSLEEATRTIYNIDKSAPLPTTVINPTNPPLGDTPLVVLTSDQMVKNPEWKTLQDSLSQFSSSVQREYASSDHFVPHYRGFQILKSIRTVITKATGEKVGIWG
eukprot:TRINITY_DN6015_c0_g2_i1.p1 TRINITY_DN6015_c0_g2~~TRINITY_DN6015_c0_g2_i1.p1  ORF type:complete len:513 (-),score=97.31 TRINITY_DN6015_c0_g2_i1:54-1592(-)